MNFNSSFEFARSAAEKVSKTGAFRNKMREGRTGKPFTQAESGVTDRNQPHCSIFSIRKSREKSVHTPAHSVSSVYSVIFSRGV